MHRIKTTGTHTQQLKVEVWPVQFLKDLREAMFNRETYAKGTELWGENKYDEPIKLRDLTQEEVETLYHIDSLIKLLYNYGEKK